MCSICQMPLNRIDYSLASKKHLRPYDRRSRDIRICPQVMNPLHTDRRLLHSNANRKFETAPIAITANKIPNQAKVESRPLLSKNAQTLLVTAPLGQVVDLYLLIGR